MVLALREDLVTLKKNKAVIPNLPQEVDIKWIFSEISPHGFTGDPGKATSAKGKKMKEALVNHLVSFIKEMDKINWQY